MLVLSAPMIVFLRIGGDSIAAMRLVTALNKAGLSLTVADVFRQPRLNDLALTVREISDTELSTAHSIAPFSLLKQDMDVGWARMQAASLCSVADEEVEDVFPCTPLQEAFLAMTSFQSGDFVALRAFDLPAAVDLERFGAAWAQTVQSIPILRTRIVDLSGQGLVQVVLDQPGRCLDATEAVEHEKQDLGLGKSLSHASITRDPESGKLTFTIVMHHALYDLWLLPMILENMEQSYRGVTLSETLPFNTFVRHLLNVDPHDSDQYWKTLLAGLEAAQFPMLPSPTYRPRAGSLLEHHIEALNWTDRDFTAATTIRSAWAILQARYTTSSEALFGVMNTGRQAFIVGHRADSRPHDCDRAGTGRDRRGRNCDAAAFEGPGAGIGDDSVRAGGSAAYPAS